MHMYESRDGEFVLSSVIMISNAKKEVLLMRSGENKHLEVLLKGC